MDYAETLRAVLLADPVRLAILRAVRSLALPDCWIGAGFVRNAVWDHLHGRPPERPGGDVDVIWFAAGEAASDQALESALHSREPEVPWSVRNQARMHVRNGDRPYACAADAIRYWPETATAVAVRLAADGGIEIAAPLGLDDLFRLVLRPGPAFTTGKRQVFLERVRSKRWLETWPNLRVASESVHS